MTLFDVRRANRRSNAMIYDATPPRGVELVFDPAGAHPLDDRVYALTAKALTSAAGVTAAVGQLIEELRRLEAVALATLEEQQRSGGHP